MRYARARFERYLAEFSFRAYITDQILLDAQGKQRTDRWADAFIGTRKDERTADEIIDEVVNRAGLKEVS